MFEGSQFPKTLPRLAVKDLGTPTGAWVWGCLCLGLGGGHNWASELGLRVPGCRIQGSRVLGSSGARRLVVGGGWGGECGCCTWLGNELSCSSLKVLNSPAVRRAHAGLRHKCIPRHHPFVAQAVEGDIWGNIPHLPGCNGSAVGEGLLRAGAPTVQSQAPIPSQAGRSEQVWIRSCANLTLQTHGWTSFRMR